MKQDKPRKPRFIKPPNVLKQKVGIGGFDEKLIARSQEFIEKVEVDFIPYAEKYLQDFSRGVKAAAGSNDNFSKVRNDIIYPVMQLKANGGMFQYQLVSEVADIALQFLEAVDNDTVNNETLDVLRAHEKTLKVIIANKLKGSGGQEGFRLIQELDKACKRYFSKYKKAE
ncbi:MAG: hypothetical protein DYH13_10245 [Alphaproteobacteria bacterium PRO2]|nr:hypothetical protein [Alphaproteobacteria bacterium PRO2]